MRGTLEGPYGGIAKVRFIPACAGNTCFSLVANALAAVHPRLCGEHCDCMRFMWSCAGSSPPVRGTLACECLVDSGGRFIPACAGNTKSAVKFSQEYPVHPRLCGEHTPSTRMPCSSLGSSPPVRGTRYRQCIRRNDHRFIPACAGNTDGRAHPETLATVHPRLCGEHAPHEKCATRLFGSSPPVRGTHAFQALVLGKARFIPACAGNTFSFVSDYCPKPVHPRLCGEHPFKDADEYLSAGSSPPVRGTRP